MTKLGTETAFDPPVTGFGERLRLLTPICRTVREAVFVVPVAVALTVPDWPALTGTVWAVNVAEDELAATVT